MVLKDVTLASIIRDEMMNPAGGVADFLDSTLPYVEAGVVVDTGSKDGTKDVLHDYERKYPNLRVHHIKFRGFAKSRNFSLRKVQTKYVLVLDADERITRQGFDDLQAAMESTPRRAYNFPFVNVFPDREEPASELFGYTNLNPRLFEVSNTEFRWVVAETLWYNGTGFEDMTFGTPSFGKYDMPHKLDKPAIYHFQPNQALVEQKREDFYEKFRGSSKKYNFSMYGDGLFMRFLVFAFELADGCKPPSRLSLTSLPYYEELRRYNPRRERYR
jgi:glycosyltransferase involved in cell wall biosynthesis